MLSARTACSRSTFYRVHSLQLAMGCRCLSTVSQSDVDFFRKEGYLAVENFFDHDEIAAIRAGLIKLKNMGRLANVATEGDGVTHTKIPKNLQLCPLSPELSIFKSLPFNRKVSTAMAQLLRDESIDGEQDICCYLSQTFWKPGNHGLGTGIHQDNAYFLLEKPNFGTAFWIPIHKSNKENGTLKVVRGFAKANDYENGTPLPHTRDGTSDHHVTCKDYIDAHHKDDIVDIELDVGGVAFFNNNVPHATGPNLTDSPRAAVAYHFLNMNHFKERQFPLPEGTEYVTPIVIGPNCTDGRKEYGYPIGVKQWLQDMQNMLKEEEQILQTESEQNAFREVKQDRNTQET